MRAPPDIPVRISLPTWIERVGNTPGRQRLTRTRETIEDLDRLNDDPNALNYIVMIMRPGARYFGTYLEYTFYPPHDGALNARFQFRVVEWEGLTWTVVTIPRADRGKAEQAVNRAELRIVNGVPAVIRSDGIAHFPVKGPNSFGLESLSAAPCYRGQTSEALALALENEECDELVDTYERNWRAAR